MQASPDRNGGRTANGPEREWLGAASLLLGMNLQSIMPACPRCGRTGLAMSQWVPSLVEKPVYVMHENDGGPPRRCRLGSRQADRVREDVRLSHTDLRRLLRKAKPYVLFSGGSDSLCLLLYLKGLAKGTGAELTAIHIDTTAGFPEVTRYVRRVCKRLGVRLQVVRPKRDYFELAKRWGIPSFSARWCCEELKIKPVRDFLARVPDPKIVFDGIRAAESAQRSKYLPVWYHPTFRCLSVSPILTWSHEQVRNYVEASGIPPSPAAQFGCSAECWCGAYKKRADFERLLQVHPDIFDKLVAVERAQKGRFTFLYEDGERIPLTTLKARRSRRNGRST